MGKIAGDLGHWNGGDTLKDKKMGCMHMNKNFVHASYVLNARHGAVPTSSWYLAIFSAAVPPQDPPSITAAFQFGCSANDCFNALSASALANGLVIVIVLPVYMSAFGLYWIKRVY
jgi:hypothetical protein